MFWVVVAISAIVIIVVLTIVYIWELRVRLKTRADLHHADLRYWINERDRWRNLAERLANEQTIAEHEFQYRRWN